MGLFRETGRVVLTCLTALLMLVSGVVRLECRCPDGGVKPFCLGTAAGAGGCCCGGPCCPDAPASVFPGQEPGTRCCCQQHGNEASESADSSEGLQPPGCAKTLHQPGVYTPTSAPTTVVADPEIGLSFAAASPAWLPARAEASHAAWQAHLLAPPTNLLALLQRLLI